MRRVLVFAGCVVCPLVVIAEAGVLVALAERGQADTVSEIVSTLVLGLSPVGVVWVAAVCAVVHVVRNARLSGGGKAAWVAALCLAYVFVLPVYWPVHLREAGGRRAGTEPV